MSTVADTSSERRKQKCLARAIEAVERLDDLWGLLYGNPHHLCRYPDDEYVYQSYRVAVLTVLARDPAYEAGWTLACRLLPRTLPTNIRLAAMVDGSDAVPSDLQELRGELIALAFELWEPVELDYETDGDIDSWLPDDESFRFNALVRRVKRERAAFEKRELDMALALWASVPFDPSEPAWTYGEPSPEASGTPNEGERSSVGRKPIALDYEQARRAYWIMCDEYADGGERRKPSVTELCERLSEQGIRIADRTFHGRVTTWRAQGFEWPPSRPSDIDTAA